MIPDYNIDNPKYQGRTCIPENGVAKARPSDLKLLLRDAPPKSEMHHQNQIRPLVLSHICSADQQNDVNSSSTVYLRHP
jgi:hypothetical protein